MVSKNLGKRSFWKSKRRRQRGLGMLLSKNLGKRRGNAYCSLARRAEMRTLKQSEEKVGAWAKPLKLQFFFDDDFSHASWKLVGGIR